MSSEIVAQGAAPGISVRYARRSPDTGKFFVPGPGVIVEYMVHDLIEVRIADRIALTGRLDAGTVLEIPRDGLYWRPGSDISETVEVVLLGEAESTFPAAVQSRSPLPPPGRQWSDPLLAGVCTAIRRALVSGGERRERLAELGAVIARHLALREGVRVPRPVGGLDATTLALAMGRLLGVPGDPEHVEALAEEMRVGHLHFVKAFRVTTGVSPQAFCLGLRMDRAAVALRRTRDTVEAVAEAAGFDSLPQFRRQFRAHWGTTPVAFRSPQGSGGGPLSRR